jgi:hypothetical protein
MTSITVAAKATPSPTPTTVRQARVHAVPASYTASTGAFSYTFF